MAPALAPVQIARDASSCAALGAALGALRALLPLRGRAAVVPDVCLVGCLLTAVQAYAASLSAGGQLRWYLLAAAALAAALAESLAAPPVRAAQRLLALPVLAACRMLVRPLLFARARAAQMAKQRKKRKSDAKKSKKNLPTAPRLLYNSMVSMDDGASVPTTLNGGASP